MLGETLTPLKQKNDERLQREQEVKVEKAQLTDVLKITNMYNALTSYGLATEENISKKISSPNSDILICTQVDTNKILGVLSYTLVRKCNMKEELPSLGYREDDIEFLANYVTEDLFISVDNYALLKGSSLKGGADSVLSKLVDYLKTIPTVSEYVNLEWMAGSSMKTCSTFSTTESTIKRDYWLEDSLPCSACGAICECPARLAYYSTKPTALTVTE